MNKKQLLFNNEVFRKGEKAGLSIKEFRQSIAQIYRESAEMYSSKDGKFKLYGI